MFPVEESEQQSSLFGENSRWLKVILILMFLLAALIRRDEIKAPGHLIEREYNSAIFARSFYYAGNDSVEQWQRDIARIAQEQLPALEPPVTEYLVSLVYRILGHEEIWYARYITSMFWLVGGIFFTKTVRLLLSPAAALFAAAYYLFVPMGIIISRSFQPDALMMMLFLIGLYCIVRYAERPSWQRLILAGSITGVTLFFRPLVLFTTFGAFIAISIRDKGVWKGLFSKHFAVFCLLSLLPPLAYYGYGIYIAGFLRGQADLSFRPYLLMKWEFWQGWFDVGTVVIGYTALIASILGFWLLPKNLTRTLILGLMGGYILFGLFFTFHIHSHPYYHIQLFPIIGICLSSLMTTFGNSLKKLPVNNWWIPVIACSLVALYFSYREVSKSYYTRVFEPANIATEIGDLVGHSSKTVFVAYHYGLPLEYYGHFSGVPWPVSIDDPFYRSPDEKERSVQERLNSLGFIPEYFIITNFDLYNRKHQDLKVYLEENCSINGQTDQYLVYGSCQSTKAILYPDNALMH